MFWIPVFFLSRWQEKLRWQVSHFILIQFLDLCVWSKKFLDFCLFTYSFKIHCGACECALQLAPQFSFTFPLIIVSFICRVFETDGVKLVVDGISYDFVKGATVDYEEELIRSAFVVSSKLRFFIFFSTYFSAN